MIACTILEALLSLSIDWQVLAVAFSCHGFITSRPVDSMYWSDRKTCKISCNEAHLSVSNNDQNNPLHISLFPAEGEEQSSRNRLEFSFMLSTSLDIFEARMPTKPVGQDFGLLQAIDERLAMYGWLTNTGVKFVIVVDMCGRVVQPQGGKTMLPLGLKNSDLTPVRCIVRCMISGLTSTVFSCAPKCIHSSFAEPFLCTGRPFPYSVKCSPSSWIHADHQQIIHPRDRSYWSILDTRSSSSMRSSGV